MINKTCMKVFSILVLIVFMSGFSFGQNEENKSINMDTFSYSKNIGVLHHEIDSLTNILKHLDRIIDFNKRIGQLQKDISESDEQVKDLRKTDNTLTIILNRLDTTTLINEINLLTANNDSLKVYRLLRERDFFNILLWADKGDNFCKCTKSFIQQFLTELYIYRFKNGSNNDLKFHKSKAKEFYNTAFRGILEQMFYPDLLDKTFINARSQEEFYKYLDVLLSIDISKCD